MIGVDTPPELHQFAKLDRDAKRSHQDRKAIQEIGTHAYRFTKKLVQGEKIEC